MKRLIFVFYLCIVITIGFIDDITDRLADSLSMSKTDVQICLNKANVNLTDLMMMDQLMNDDMETANIHNSALKVGCLFACLLQKKGLMVGTHINVERIKKEMDNKLPLNAKKTTIRNRILNICIDQGKYQVKSKTNECEVIFRLSLCVVAEAKRYQNSKNI